MNRRELSRKPGRGTDTLFNAASAREMIEVGLRLIADLSARGIGVGARESLANGFLTGAVTRETVFEQNNLSKRYP